MKGPPGARGEKGDPGRPGEQVSSTVLIIFSPAEKKIGSFINGIVGLKNPWVMIFFNS